MTPLRALVRAEAVIFLRDKVSLFFTFLFPVIFILIFGFLMGDIDDPSATLGLHVSTGTPAEELGQTHTH